jgi:hypothetical protein
MDQRISSKEDRPGAKPDAAGADAPGADAARRLPVPVPLLLQLCRPLNTLDDVQALAAQLASARARGCF